MKHLRILSAAMFVALVLVACAPVPQATVALPSLSPVATVPLPEAYTPSPSAPTPTATPGPVLITYWEEESDDGDVVLDELAKVFMEENPDIKVERAHFGYQELRDLFRTASLNGRPPDLIRGPSEYTGPFSGLGIVQPAEDVLDPSVFDQFLPGALEATTEEGRVWGLPDNYNHHLMLLYNRKLVDAVPTDTDAWIAQLKTLTDPIQGQYGLVYNLNEPFWVVPWIGSFGGWPIDDQGNPSLATQAVEKALQFVQNLKLVHRVVPPEADYDVAYDLFKRGQAAYIIDGAWNLDRYQGVGLDVGVAALPKVSETGLYPSPMTSGEYWFIGKGAEGSRLEAATRFVEYMTSAQAQLTWLAEMRRLPSNREAAKSDLVVQDPVLAGSMDELSKGRGLPPAPNMFCVWHSMGMYLPDLMAGTMQPTDAAQAMQAEAQRCLDELNDTGTLEGSQ